MRSRIYTIFGCAKVRIVQFATWNSVVLDFRTRSSEVLFSRDSRFTRRFQELNRVYNWEPPVSKSKVSFMVLYTSSTWSVQSVGLCGYLWVSSSLWIVKQFSSDIAYTVSVPSILVPVAHKYLFSLVSLVSIILDCRGCGWLTTIVT